MLKKSSKANKNVTGRGIASPVLISISLAGFTSSAQENITSSPSTAAPPTQSSLSSLEHPPSYYGTSDDLLTPAIAGTGLQSPFGFGDASSLFEEDPLKYGPFRLIPHADYRLTYATDLLRAPGETEESVLHSISPGLSIQSPHITFDYTPSLLFYTQGSFEDTVNHFASVRARFGFGDWIFGISHSYSVGSSPVVEAAGQVDFENHNTNLSATYLISERVSLDLTASQRLQDSGDYNDSKTWSTMNWLNYAVNSTTTVGVGAGGGYSDVETGSDMTYELFQGRIGWQPGKKLEIDFNGGFEIRQFLGVDGTEDKVNPIFGGSVNYNILEATSLFLNANHSVNTSLFDSQITESFDINFGVRQRFFERLNASLAVGYRNTEYQTTTQGFVATPDRTDDVSYVSIGIGTTFLKKGSASVSYSYNQNNSSLEGYTYDNNQIGFQIGYRF